jgi:predicted O-methyltransferase YrrM
MNAVIEQIFAHGTVESASGEVVDIRPTSISYEEGMMLYDTVRQLGARQTLEVGLAYGISTLFICQALRDGGGGEHTAFDPLQSSLWKSIGLLNVQRAHFQDSVRFWEAPSHSVLPDLLRAGDRFDFIFVDGAHLFDFALLDFYYANLLLKPTGHLLLHDLWMPSVRKLLTFVVRNYPYRIVDTPGGPRTSFLRPWSRMASVLRQSPLEVYTWLLPITQRRPALYAHNMCLLQRLGDDARPWNHYRPF